ncbi:sensor histidine kinase [Treponema sp.]|uniref:sensor histidine kinase n=1 Tax=Treponema sp. TaxID=166 RepID=UPI0025CCF618|nr:histidine kinase [Treponema sp.]MCR5218272.1 histidine kinase [Treponema sp.]
MKVKSTRRSIRRKVIIFGYRILSPLFLFIVLFLCFHSFRAKFSDIRDKSKTSAHSIALNMKLMQDEIKQLSTYIGVDNDIRSIFLSDKINEMNANPILWMDVARIEKLQTLIALNGNIKSFALYPENGVQPYLRGMDGTVNIHSVEDVRRTREYARTMNSLYGMYWCSVPKSRFGTFEINRQDKIVFYREIYGIYDKIPLCFMAIALNREQFKKICQASITSRGESCIVFNSDGEELCSIDNYNNELRKYIRKNIITSFNEQNNFFSFYYKGNYVSCCKLDEYGSVVCDIISLKAYKIFFLQQFLIYLYVLILILLSLYVLLKIMSKYITKPLYKLSEGITKFAEGDFTQHVKIYDDDEIGDVAKAFNKMVSDIQSLINENYVIKMKEKENELASLQSQINPHFLYNTLNSLYWQAVDHNNETLADNIFSLSRLFQLVLSRGKQEILVENEFELIERYLEVQKMRFNTKLQYAILLDDRIKKQKFSKLLLQPFVENSIEHGFSNKTSECNLMISGKLVDDRMVFEIKDSGIGMSQEDIQSLFTGEKKVDHNRVGGYAIKNIIDRIKILYGDEGIVQIDSVPGEGTSVKITVPFSEDLTAGENDGKENSDS